MIRGWLLLLAMCAAPATAEIAVSANDGKQVLVNGQQVVPAPRAPDSVSIIDFGWGKVRTIATIAVPTSIIGPPASVAVTPDGSYAVVTSARRVTQDGAGIEPDDIVSVVDLRRAVVASSVRVGAGAGPAGVAIDPSGSRVLVANRAGHTVSLFALARGALTPLFTLPLGPGSSPAQPMFFAGGRRALVARDGDHQISVLAIEGDRLRLEGPGLRAGLRPYPLDIARHRPFAVVGAIGGGGRDVDTISLIDLSRKAPKVVDTVAVGLTPEGVSVSPDGGHVAVTVNNGSNAAPGSEHHHPQGLLQVWRIAAGRLVKVAEAPMGGWGQGMIWSRDGRQILAQAARDNRIESFGFDGHALRRGAVLRLAAGPAAIATNAP